MNKKNLGILAIVLGVIIAGSYIATNATIKGSVFETGTTKNIAEVKTIAQQEQTPTDYTLTKLTVYLPPESANQSAINTPEEDNAINNQGISTGDISTKYKSNKEKTYLARAVIQNIGTTTAGLPKIEVSLNDTNISKISGMVKFSKITKDGLEALISIPANSPFLQGNNTLTVTLDSENKIIEASKQNNSVSVEF